ERLSHGRSASVSRHFDRFMKEYIDSTARESGFSIDEDGNVVKAEKLRSVPFIAKYTDENWPMLDTLVEKDERMTPEEKQDYFDIAARNSRNRDQREWAMKERPWYKYMKDTLYPKLRVVSFNFNLHRKGMVEEFIQTEEVDTTYARGVQYLRDRDYKAALEILQDYDDY
ncbi:lipoprotein, partial [gut metagenome]